MELKFVPSDTWVPWDAHFHLRLETGKVENKAAWDFPGGPKIKTLPSNAGGGGLILGWGTKIPHIS